MKHWTILLSMLVSMSSSFVMAQEDDMYFSPKRVKKEQTVRKVEVVYEEEDSNETTSVVPQKSAHIEYRERDVDEYNRRGHVSQASVNVQDDDEINNPSSKTKTYELSPQSLYDLGYSEGYRQGYEDGEDVDYYYGIRLARFHGRHFFDPWYWGSISLVHDPWYWDPWYCDPWYRPYYYGGWCSVGWGVGFWGSYWHSPWHGWHTMYPSYIHHSHGGHWGVSHGPRYSTVRNRDYGRARIMDRTTRIGNSGRYGKNGDRVSTSGSVGDGRTHNNRISSGRTSRDRFTERSIDRYNRASERAGNRVSTRSSGRSDRNSVSRPATRNTDRTERRSIERSSTRSSSLPRSNGSVGGNFGRSMGGSRGGGGGRGR